MQFHKEREKILIIDFGSQVTKLIGRKIRELGVYSEIITPYKFKKLKKFDLIKGIILSGGPLNVYQLNNKIFDKKIINLGIPILGICFGHQILSKFNGGRVKKSKHREFGLAKIFKKNNSLLVKNFFNKQKSNQVWMSHADQVSRKKKNSKKLNLSLSKKLFLIQKVSYRIYIYQKFLIN